MADDPEVRRAVQVIAQRAAALLATLDAPARAAVQRPFPDERLRHDWHYVPRRRAGRALDELTRPQRKAVHRLLAASLALPAYGQVAAVMALEDVLDELEGGTGHRRRDDYSVLLFGEPEGASPWGWRFEGHHVSLHLTVVDGEPAATPSFLGANPAALRRGDAAVLRPLAQEEELARALLGALDGPALRRAVVAERAPSDITTRAAARVAAEPLGVARAELSEPAAAALDALVRLYLDRLPPALATARWDRLVAEGLHEVRFAWAGPPQRGAGHYYRVSGPGLLLEYDCTQDAANHVHTVLRDPERDFGDDLLAAHYARDHDVSPSGA